MKSQQKTFIKVQTIDVSTSVKMTRNLIALRDGRSKYN